MSNFLTALGDLGLSAGSSLLSGAIGNSFARKNMRDAQAWQEKMYDKQKEFWYEQQDYNSPANQVARIREAGLNPQFMLGGIQSGQLGSSPSVGSPSPAQTMAFGDAAQNFAALTGARTQSRLADADIRDRNADATLKEINANYRAFEAITGIYEALSRIDKNKAGALKDHIDSWATGITTRMEWMLGNQQIKESEQRIENLVTENMIKQEELKWLPQEKKLQIQSFATDIALKVATKELTLEQAKKIWFDNNDLWQTAEGKRLDNELKEKSFAYLVDKAAKEAVSGVGIQDILGAGIMGIWHSFKDK